MHIHYENAHRIKCNDLALNSQIQGIRCQWISMFELQLYKLSLKGLLKFKDYTQKPVRYIGDVIS